MDPSTSQFKRHRRIRDSRRQFAQKQPTKPLVDQSKVKKTSWSVRNCQKNMMVMFWANQFVYANELEPEFVFLSSSFANYV